VGLSTQEKEAAIIAAAFGVAESKAGLEAKEKEVTTQHQQRLDVEADMSAERARRVLNIEAEARAEADQKRDLIAAQADYDVRQKKADALKYEDVTKAEADKLEAEQTAEQIQITADAEAKASEKRNHAMQQEAEGTAAMQAAAGYAEANVMKAKAEAKTVDADAEKALGLAEAAVIEAQGQASGTAKAAEGEGEAKGIAAKGTAEGVAIESKGVAEGKSVEAIRLAEAQGAEKLGLAEALAKTEMAKAIELFNKASQDHEEFRLQLDKDKDVELADINIKKDIADAQARVMGEALKSANIDLVGGEQDFFDRVVSSVSQGKVVDRLVDNSQTITDVKNTFFNGDPDHLKNKLAGWIKASGLKSEDVKNLTISALLASMVSKTEDNSLRGLMRAAEKAVRGTEIGSELASTILGDKLGK
jgi:flotillin